MIITLRTHGNEEAGQQVLKDMIAWIRTRDDTWSSLWGVHVTYTVSVPDDDG